MSLYDENLLNIRGCIGNDGGFQSSGFVVSSGTRALDGAVVASIISNDTY